MSSFHDHDDDDKKRLRDELPGEDYESAVRAQRDSLEEDIVHLLSELTAALDDPDLHRSSTDMEDSLEVEMEENLVDMWTALKESLRYNSSVIFFALEEKFQNVGVGEKPESSTVFEILTASNDMHTDVDSFESRIQSLSLPQSGQGAVQTVKNKLAQWAKKIKNIVQSINKKLWKLLNNIMSPDEWTLSGELGQQVLGLQGTIGVGITFN